jgi:hypothetical protein
MTSPAALTVVLELDDAAGPIAGTVRRGAEDLRRFAGWLELSEVLEQIRTDPSRRNPCPPVAVLPPS